MSLFKSPATSIRPSPSTSTISSISSRSWSTSCRTARETRMVGSLRRPASWLSAFRKRSQTKRSATSGEASAWASSPSLSSSSCDTDPGSEASDTSTNAPSSCNNHTRASSSTRAWRCSPKAFRCWCTWRDNVFSVLLIRPASSIDASSRSNASPPSWPQMLKCCTNDRATWGQRRPPSSDKTFLQPPVQCSRTKSKKDCKAGRTHCTGRNLPAAAFPDGRGTFPSGLRFSMSARSSTTSNHLQVTHSCPSSAVARARSARPGGKRRPASSNSATTLLCAWSAS
mmetsp:Transcript_30810/g.89022  ORF Transcript_30810/g.89022 Transcript_30810/m.89022 type:complete len:284 (+) Transcript_30810:894-1745(+)